MFSSSVDPAALFFHLADAYVVFDADKRVVFANATYLRQSELRAEDMADKALYELPQFAALSRTAHGEAWLQHVFDELPVGETASTPYFGGVQRRQNDTKRGRVWKLKASLIPIRAELNTREGYLVAIRVSDVTERAVRDAADQREKARLRSQAQLRRILASEAAAQLRSNQEQFDAALAFAKVGAWELDAATGVIVCTEQCKINLGLEIGEALTEHRLFTEIIAADDRRRVQVRMEQALAQRKHFEAEYRLESNGPEDRWLMVRGQGQYSESGAVVSILGFTIDITARKEAELKQAREATRERDAREQSERNVLAMDHFVSAVTHELRSPLGAITSWAELLGRTQDTAHVLQAAGSLQRNARQLSLMVDDLLDTGAIVSGKLSVRRERVQMDVLAREVVSDLTWQAERKGLALKIVASPCAVLGDDARLKQVVWNLLSNAIKFTHQGAISVSVQVEGGRATVSVEDTGCGIAPDAISRIFDRFEQVRTDVAGRIGGLGLGLWLVKSLVELHDGSVQAVSAGLGHGSVFRVCLPILNSKQMPDVA